MCGLTARKLGRLICSSLLLGKTKLPDKKINQSFFFSMDILLISHWRISSQPQNGKPLFWSRGSENEKTFNLCFNFSRKGGVAKLVSRPLSMRKVPGSKPGISIFFLLFYSLFAAQLRSRLGGKWDLFVFSSGTFAMSKVVQAKHEVCLNFIINPLQKLEVSNHPQRNI